jgi:hypothetical protein
MGGKYNTDGGPDHHCTYTCVQLSYICLFLALDLDYLVAVQIPLQHSWKNPVEHIMLILNLELQSVGLMRAEMGDQSENLMNKCGTINEIRKIAEKNPNLKEDLIASFQIPIHLICDVFSQQSFKDEHFETFTAASETEIESFWETINLVDDSLINIHEIKSLLTYLWYRNICKNSLSTVVSQDATFFQSKNVINQSVPFAVLFIVHQKILHNYTTFQIQYLVMICITCHLKSYMVHLQQKIIDLHLRMLKQKRKIR